MADQEYTIGIVLSGSGSEDGSEIHESVLAMLAIDLLGAKYLCFAPDIPQTLVVNHLTNKPVQEKRNVLIESARIARGKINPLSDIDTRALDAVIFPGGFGAATNLSSFGTNGASYTVNADVERVIEEMVEQKKPIGALCIAPVLLAKTLGKVTITIGQDKEIAEILSTFGTAHTNTKQREITIDYDHKIVTTPCYMLDSRISEVYDGITKLVQNIIKLIP